MTIPDPEDLEALRARIGNDPDKLAQFENYVSLLAVLDELVDEGANADRQKKLQDEIDAARRALDE